jgi:tetratricopeptide (TPR) repeat protein/transglutaminase-like putative cysteine protease
MFNRFKLVLAAFLFILTFTRSSAQVQSPPASATPADSSKESAIIQSFHYAVRFENDGTGTREYSLQVRLQSEAGVQQYGLLTFGYSSANEQIEIPYVRVRKPDGTTITTSSEDVQDMPAEITRVAPMYSDYREKHIAVKGLGVGDVLEYQVKTQTLKPLIPGQFWFDYTFTKSGIILDEELELNLPKDRFVNVKSADIKPALKEEGSRRIYLWKTANTERKSEEDPEKETPPPPVQVSTFRSWEEVGNWWGAIEQERVTPTPEIRAKAAELTKDAKTDADKLKAIYNFVATRFRYISISFGIGRYQPHSADEVLKNAYGDCKDKHTLLASMLDAVGIKSYAALINSSLKIDPEVPSPGHFDHVISVVPQGTGWVWLDTTTEVAPFGLLTANLRDKEALVVPTDKPASLVKTPADAPFKNSIVFQLDGKLDESGTLKAKIQRADRGDSELIFRLAFRQTPQANWKDLVQRISYLSGFSGEVSDVTATSPETTDQPFSVSYNYVRKEYPDWANQRINPPTQLCSLPALNDKQLKSIEPLKLGVPIELVCKSMIELPQGYTFQLLPPADIVRDFAEYHSTYSFKGGVFEAERRIVVKLRELPAARRMDYQSLQKAASDDGNAYAVFALGTDDLLSRANQMSADDLNSAAATLLDQNKDIPTALVLLQKATTKDPNHKLAWNNLGRAYRVMGRPDEAEMAFKKQIEINPKDEYAYKNLGSVYTFKKRYDAALAIYQKYIEVNPNDKETYGYLGWTLNQMEKWDEAAQAYEKSAAMNPDKPYAYIQWGRALLKAGKVEEARHKLDRALEVDSSPMTLNNVAWELADAGVDLDKAEQEAKSAVEKTAESFAGPLSLQTPPDYTQKLGTLASVLSEN